MVYLIHFDTPIAHARHYLGFTDNLKKRLFQHEHGKGARLLEVAKQRGIVWHCVRTWADATRTDERKFKNRKKIKRYCPMCKAEGKHR